jgi:hypothetical protein
MGFSKRILPEAAMVGLTFPKFRTLKKGYSFPDREK